MVKNTVLMIVLYALVLYIRNLYSLYLCIFIVGVTQSIALIQGFAYTVEVMPLEYRNIIGTCTGLVDKILLIMSTLYLKYIGSNWITIMIPGLIASVLACIMSFFLIDSP